MNKASLIFNGVFYTLFGLFISFIGSRDTSQMFMEIGLILFNIGIATKEQPTEEER